MNDDPELRAAIIKKFGEETYAGGVLNRKYLAGQVFSDPAKTGSAEFPCPSRHHPGRS